VLPDILITDKQWTPRDWAKCNDAARYFATNKVVWSVTDNIVKTYIGGKNQHAEISRIDIPSIIAVTGPVDGANWKRNDSNFVDRQILYGRDLRLCAYCGDVFKDHELTIDHIIPSSQNGPSTWMNCVTACGPCNKRKANRTPEKARMQLLYVPYIPNKFEKILLKGRNVLADQMEFLMRKIPKSSRCWQN